MVDCPPIEVSGQIRPLHYEHKGFTAISSIFVSLHVMAWASLVAATVLFVKSWHGHAYIFIPTARVVDDYRKTLDTHYAPYPDAAQLSSKAFDEYVMNSYIDSSTSNTLVNDVRSYELHRTNTAIIYTAAFASVASAIFYFGGLDKGSDVKPLKVLITAPIALTGATMSDPKPLPAIPPPPPHPPDNRVVREGVRPPPAPPAPTPKGK
jgi:hypothetical protein